MRNHRLLRNPLKGKREERGTCSVSTCPTAVDELNAVLPEMPSPKEEERAEVESMSCIHSRVEVGDSAAAHFRGISDSEKRANGNRGISDSEKRANGNESQLSSGWQNLFQNSFEAMSTGTHGNSKTTGDSCNSDVRRHGETSRTVEERNMVMTFLERLSFVASDTKVESDRPTMDIPSTAIDLDHLYDNYHLYADDDSLIAMNSATHGHEAEVFAAVKPSMVVVSDQPTPVPSGKSEVSPAPSFIEERKVPFGKFSAAQKLPVGSASTSHPRYPAGPSHRREVSPTPSGIEERKVPFGKFSAEQKQPRGSAFTSHPRYSASPSRRREAVSPTPSGIEEHEVGSTVTSHSRLSTGSSLRRRLPRLFRRKSKDSSIAAAADANDAISIGSPEKGVNWLDQSSDLSSESSPEVSDPGDLLSFSSCTIGDDSISSELASMVQEFQRSGPRIIMQWLDPSSDT